VFRVGFGFFAVPDCWIRRIATSIESKLITMTLLRPATGLFVLYFFLLSFEINAEPNRAVLEKPAALDEANWASLKQAILAATQQARLVGDESTAGSDGEANDDFGYSVAVSGDRALIGAPLDDIGANANQGSAYVFKRSGMTWTQETKLVVADGAEDDRFGLSVALSGDTAIVGSYLDDVGANANQGSAYVFTRSGTAWTQQSKLVVADGAANDALGVSVAVSDDTVLVGAYGDDVGAMTDQGSAYVFTRSGTTWNEQAKLLPADGAVGDNFGWSVALSGDTALAGAYGDNVGANADQGSAYVFTRIGSTWTAQSKLVAPDGAANDNFGRSVALSGDTALLGAHLDDGPNTNQGSAHVFARSGTTWTHQAKLVASDGAPNDNFGGSVALSGDTVLVGAYADDSPNTDQGSAYIFTRGGTIWTEQAKLVSADGGANDRFALSVALSSDTALVGADFDDLGPNINQGSAYVFTRGGTAWTQQAKLDSGDGVANDNLGWSMALSGDTALVGAYRHDVGANSDQGSAYVFTRIGTMWAMQAKLLAADGAVGDNFGWSVALSGDTALVGSYQDDGLLANQGSAYVFTRSGTTWTEQAKLVASDGAGGDNFGFSVALSGDTVLVGASEGNGSVADQGSAYVFTRTGTTWAQEAKLLAPDGAMFDLFGYSVALYGDTALVGEIFDDVGLNNGQGSAHVFERAGTLWTRQAKLVASDGASGDFFGRSVALFGDTALVGVDLDDQGANADQGSAYVFTRNGVSWIEQAKLMGSDGAANDRFGFSVALSGDAALVGAPLDDIGANPDQGSAYVFMRIGTTWTQRAKLLASDGSANDQSGQSVSLSNGSALMGGPFSDGMIPYGNPNEGTAYAFTDIDRESTTTTIGSMLPDPSQVGAIAPISVSVIGASMAPADGLVTVLASTGETCSDPSPSAGGGSTAQFTCDLTFGSVGPRTVTATFSGSTTHDGSVSAVEAHAVVTTLVVTPASLASGLFGVAYSDTFAAGGTASSPPYAFAVSSGVLPGGLMLHPGTGSISGTPSEAGTFNFTVTATDSSASAVGGPFSGSRQYTVEIARANQAVLNASATPTTILFNANSSLATSGGSGTGGVAFAVASGASFCSIAGNTLTGIGVGMCTVTATKAADANFNAASASVDVTVQAATDLEVSNLDETTYAIPGSFSEYGILVANAGLLPVEDARLQHPLPEGLSNAVWTCTPVQGASCPAASGTGGIDALVDLPANSVLRYVFSAEVIAGTGASIVSTATITTPVGTTESDPADNQATDTNSVVPDGLFGNGFEAAARRISVPIPPE